MLIESPPQTGRLVSFRLADVPLELRKRAAEQLRRYSPKHGFQALLEDAELTRAALLPSETVYRIPEDAWSDVMG